MRTSTRAVRVLAALVVLVVLGVQVPVVHGHDAPTPGVYNEECFLERLAVGPGGATIPEPPAVTPWLPATPLALGPAMPAPLVLSCLTVRVRAPPATA
jgi:hypothetical protein